MHFRLCVAMGDISNILGGALGYSWDTRGIFVGYSWGIRMYRVCIGYVSGMYREYIERYGEGKNEKKMRFFSVGGLLNVPVFRLSTSISMSIIPNAIRVPMFMRSCANHPILPLKTLFIS